VASVIGLHLGAGDHLLPGWINTDLEPVSSEVVRVDATARLPYPDGAFRFVFTEHMIEHLDFADNARLLAECRRVLQARGVLRVATPDLQFLRRLAGPRLTSIERKYVDWAYKRFVNGGIDECPVPFVVNNFFRAWGHRFIFDEPLLRATLRRAGFRRVVRRDLLESPHAELRRLEHVWRIPLPFLRLETMVVEATF
jgi:SAM-dependent methyltransferase